MNSKWKLKKALKNLIYSNNTHWYSVEILKKEDGDEIFRRRLTRQVSMHTLIGFNELRLNDKLCDASIILDNSDTFPVHRSVLSGSSDYFRLVWVTKLVLSINSEHHNTLSENYLKNTNT